MKSAGVGSFGKVVGGPYRDRDQLDWVTSLISYYGVASEFFELQDKSTMEFSSEQRPYLESQHSQTLDAS